MLVREFRRRLGDLLEGVQEELSRLYEALPETQRAERDRCASLMASVEGGLQSLKDLDPEDPAPLLLEKGLVPAFTWLGRDFQQRTGRSLVMELPPDSPECDAELGLDLFYLAQELLHYVARHARSPQVHLSLQAEPEAFLLQIDYEGPGSAWNEESEEPEGLGLFGVRARVHLWGGAFRLQAVAPQGTRLWVRLPHPPSFPVPPASKPQWRVLIGAEPGIVRAGLRQLLAGAPHRLLIQEAPSVQEVAEAVGQQAWEVVLLDISTDSEERVELLGQWARAQPPAPVLALNARDDAYSVRAVRAGVLGYMNWEEAGAHLLEALEQVVSGRRYMGPGMAVRLCSDDRAAPEPHAGLSDREYQLLGRLAQGQKRAAIARAMHLSPSTVSTYRERLMKKMGWQTQGELLVYARHHGLG